MSSADEESSVCGGGIGSHCAGGGAAGGSQCTDQFLAESPGVPSLAQASDANPASPAATKCARDVTDPVTCAAVFRCDPGCSKTA